MGRNHWNPQRWHRKHSRPRRHSPLWGPALVVAMALITGGVAATQGVSLGADSDRVGICHATGAGDAPSVYIVVDRDSADHAAHATHTDDILDASSQGDCPGAAQTTTADEQALCTHEPTVTGSDSADAGAQPQAPANAGNGSTDPPANTTENQTQPEAADPDLEGLCDADVSVNHTASVNGSWVRFDVRVDSIGTAEANDVLLNATFPDVGRAWRLVGTAPDGCALQERELSCEFGDLLPNASRAVAVKAARCEDDCGDDLEAVAIVSAHNDGNATNNEATGVLVVEDCPRGAPPTDSATPEPSPNSTAPGPTSTPTSSPGNDSTEAGNQTGNETAGNETENATEEPREETNATEPENTSAPAPADASVAQRAVQSDDEVVLTIVVRSWGPGTAQSVSLADTLPDVRRSWYLGGADASDCTLDGRWLNCAFGDLQPGATRTISLRAFTDRLACGQHLTNNATVTAVDDARASNDRSSASIAARGC